jgi:hypothetical protein
MSQVPPEPEPSEIESALARLTPARIRIDRDRVMFQAGILQAQAASRRPWVWPSIAATLAVVALSESAMLAVRPAPQVTIAQQAQPRAESRPTEPKSAPEPVEVLSQSSAAEPQDPGMWYAGGGESLALRRQVLRFGIDGMPELPPLLSQSDIPPTESPQTLRRDQLNKLLETGGPS